MEGLFSHIFLTVFVYCSPIEFAIRIFGLFLLDKEEALISYTVKVIKLMETKILSFNSVVYNTLTIGCIHVHKNTNDY